MLDSLINLDEALFQWINSGIANSFFDTSMVLLRNKLFWIPLYLFLLIFISYNFQSSKWKIYLSIGIMILVSDTLSSKVIKPAVQRARPCQIEYLQPEIRIPCGSGYSFTSSHATNHFALAGYFFLLFGFTKWRYAFFIWAGLVSFAQIYVGQHFPLDILGGMMLGLIIGWLIFRLYRLMTNKSHV